MVHKSAEDEPGARPGPGKYVACGGPRVAHPSGWVCGAPPPEWCVHADCSPFVFGGTSVHWCIVQGTLIRRPCSGLQNVPLIVAPVWPTLLVGSVGHPPRNGACRPISCHLFWATLFFIGPRRFRPSTGRLASTRKYAACCGPRVAHPSGWVCGAPPPEWCVLADCGPFDFGGTSVHWCIEQGTLFRRPCSGLQNVPLIVAPMWPTFLVGSEGHPPRNGACRPISCHPFWATLCFIGPRRFRPSIGRLAGTREYAACCGPRVAHPSGGVCGAPPPEWCVDANCSPLCFCTFLQYAG